MWKFLLFMGCFCLAVFGLNIWAFYLTGYFLPMIITIVPGAENLVFGTIILVVISWLSGGISVEFSYSTTNSRKA